MDNSDRWLEEAEEFLRTRGAGITGSGSEARAFATSMLAALYGPESAQMRQFRDGFEGIKKTAANPDMIDHHSRLQSLGVIRNTVAELKAGLIVPLRVAVAGEVFGEMIRLGKEIGADQSEEAKNVASVLTAAAYEGLIRRMGEEFAGVSDRPKLEDVVGALKNAGALKGGEVGTALSYLKFRNDSLHADWKNVSRSQVESCLAFSESLLLKHFSD